MAKDKIISNFVFLIQNVEPAPILDILIQRGHTNVANIRTECKNDKSEANRLMIESLPRMKDGKGYEHYIDALKEEGMFFVLKKLGYMYPEDVTPATCNVTASNRVEPAQISDHVSTVAQSALGKPTGNSISIDGAPLDESDGVANSQAKDTDYDDTATSADAACKSDGRNAKVVNYEEYRREPIEHEHEYDTMKESGMNVRLVKPTTLQCSKQVPSSCPDELSALTKDAAWHAHINDTTIHKVVKDLCACPAGTYIMWYSTKKSAMLVSVAVPEISKKHVHFKMVRTETEGVSRPHYHFDSRLHSKDPLAVLQYAKENGLVIKPAKLRHYQSQF